MGRDDNNYTSRGNWQDISGKNAIQGTTLIVPFQSASGGFTGAPPVMNYTPEDILGMLKPEQIEMRFLTPADTALLESAFVESLDIPMPFNKWASLLGEWSALKAPKNAPVVATDETPVTMAETLQPATA